jgi:Ca2+-binding EF-hand superfamily protein
MNPDNAVDIIESFHVMDQEKMGEITAQQCYTLVLGLGMDVPRADLNALILQYNDQNLNHITLHVVLKLLKQVSKTSVVCSLGGV